MRFKNAFSGFFFLVAAGLLGLALIYLPNWIVSNYQIAAGLGKWAGIAYLIIVGSGALLLMLSSGWVVWRLWGATITKKFQRERRNRNPSQLTTVQQAAEIDENINQVTGLRDAGLDAAATSQLQKQLEEFQAKRAAQVLEIVAFGTISSGKSSALNLLAGTDLFKTDIRGGTTVTRNQIPWPGQDKVILVDTPGLGEVDGANHVSIAAAAAKDADLVLLVVDGPLRQSEFNLVQKLAEMEKRIVVCLNKSDWYSPEDRQKLIAQIGAQTRSIVASEDIVSIQAQPGSRLRKKIMADGQEIEEAVPIPPDIEALAKRMMSLVKTEGKELIMANLLLQSRGMFEKAKGEVKAALDRKAWKIVDRYMWGAGGAAAISPLPVLDLIAGSTLSTKMILDLADVYQQKVDLQVASTWLAEMGKNLIGMLGVQGASVAVASIVASLSKSVPLVGTLAGGVLQGVVQALIVKWIGAVFINYFRNDMQIPEGGLAGLARREWENLTTADELRKLISRARDKS